MKILDPDSLAFKQFSEMAESSDDFACAYVCVEFRFHLGHPMLAFVLASIMNIRF